MNMNVFGLDLGTSSIKAVQLKKEKGQLILVAAGSIPTPPRGLVSDAPLDQEAVAEAIKKLLSEIKISTRKVNAALPDPFPQKKHFFHPPEIIVQQENPIAVVSNRFEKDLRPRARTAIPNLSVAHVLEIQL